MAVGARDNLDKLLVKKYAGIRVDNPIVETSMVNPEKMMDAMNDYADAQRAMLNMQSRLRETCIKTVAMSIQYRKTRNISKSGLPA